MNKSVTIEQIENLNGIDLIHEVFVSIAIRESQNHKSMGEFVKSLPEEKKLVYAIWILDMSVKNGGFQQFYDHSDGKINEVVVRASEEMKMQKITGIVKRANGLYIKNKTSENAEISELRGSELESLDLEYYQADTKNYIYNSISNYIKSNKAKFIS